MSEAHGMGQEPIQDLDDVSEMTGSLILGTTGGLEDEHEDLRLHVPPFQKAFDLIASGELTAGPIMLMLLWLDRWRTANA